MFCPGYDDAYHKASAVYFQLNLMLPPWLAEMLMQPKKTHTFAMKKKIHSALHLAVCLCIEPAVFTA